MLMFTAPGSLKYLLYGMVGFLLLSGISVTLIQQFPVGDSRVAVGLPLILCTFGVLLYATYRAERHTWDVIKQSRNGVPVFYSFGENNTMLVGHQRGWVGYGVLQPIGTNGFQIDSKHALWLEQVGSGIQFGTVSIDNKVQSVACITSSDGKQLFLWQPKIDIRSVLGHLEESGNQSKTTVTGIPLIEDWPVIRPTRLTTRGVWPTLLVVGILQVGLVYLAKLAELPQLAWTPVGLTVAPMLYFLFECGGRNRSISFGELLERQVVAQDAKSFS